MHRDSFSIGLAGDSRDAPTPPRECPACGSSPPRSYPHNLSRCEACGHVFQTDLAVRVAYDAAYARRYDSLPHRRMSAVRWSYIAAHVHLPPSSRVLDVGYGNGAFLKHARGEGMDVFGIDVHGEDFGFPETTYADPGLFDLVCFFDSLEHFAEFTPLFGLRARHAVVSLPATPPDLLEAPLRWRHFKPGEHLHYFSPESLDRLMARWGFASRIAAGCPEDAVRGKLPDGSDNIHTAIYAR